MFFLMVRSKIDRTVARQDSQPRRPVHGTVKRLDERISNAQNDVRRVKQRTERAFLRRLGEPERHRHQHHPQRTAQRRRRCQEPALGQQPERHHVERNALEEDPRRGPQAHGNRMTMQLGGLFSFCRCTECGARCALQPSPQLAPRQTRVGRGAERFHRHRVERAGIGQGPPFVDG